MYNLNGKRIWVPGYNGMVGSALCRQLNKMDVYLPQPGKTRLDLRNQDHVDTFVHEYAPHVIFLAAAKVGGINANSTEPADFIYDNLMIQSNVIHAAWKHGVEKLVFLGSSCIYPRDTPQPITEDSLMTGPLETTNEAYAIAKIAGIKMCQAYNKQYGCNFISVQPTNLYGPGDNYNLQTSHVLPALLRKAHDAYITGAETMTVWGSGTPLREFLHVDDLAHAVIHLTKYYDGSEPVNIGSGEEVSIRKLAHMCCDVVGFKMPPGKLLFDSTKPDGTPRKLLDCTKLNALGWNDARPLSKGLIQAYDNFLYRNI